VDRGRWIRSLQCCIITQFHVTLCRSDDMNGTLDDSLTVPSTSPPSLLAWQPAKALLRIGLRWPTELAISFADLCAWPPCQSSPVL